MNKLVKSLTSPAFLVCLAVMLIAAGGKAWLINELGVKITKHPLPLIMSFDDLNESALNPYNVVQKTKIQNKAVLESLGTEEYIQWLLEDTSVNETNPARFCQLFITYYTGNPDVVPHVPDECYTGGGNRLMSSNVDTLKLTINEVLPELNNDPKKPFEQKITNLQFGQVVEGIGEKNFNVL